MDNLFTLPRRGSTIFSLSRGRWGVTRHRVPKGASEEEGGISLRVDKGVPDAKGDSEEGDQRVVRA